MRSFHERDQPWEPVLAGGVMERTGGRSRRKFLGDPELDLHVTLGEYDPDIVVDAHSHNQPELMYVLEGEMTVAGQRCPAGTVLRVPAGTVYGPLESGPNGVRFLVVRPGPTRTIIPDDTTEGS